MVQFTAAPNSAKEQDTGISGDKDLESEDDDDDELNTTLQASPSGHIQTEQTKSGISVPLQRKVSQLEGRSPSKSKVSIFTNNLKQPDDSDIWEGFEGTDGQHIMDDVNSDSAQSESSSEEEDSDTDTEDNFDIKDIILHTKFNNRNSKDNTSDGASCPNKEASLPDTEVCKVMQNSKSLSSPDVISSIAN